MKIVSSIEDKKYYILSYFLSEVSKRFNASLPTVSSKCLRMPQIISSRVLARYTFSSLFATSWTNLLSQQFKCWHPYLPNLYSTTEICTNLRNLKKRHQHQVKELCTFLFICHSRKILIAYLVSATLILLPRFLENENGFRFSPVVRAFAGKSRPVQLLYCFR